MKALIFHGTLGFPQGNWFPWLQEELLMQGWEVAVPTLPTPEDQSLDNWKQALTNQVPGFEQADILIGHSCGGAFTLRLLEEKMIQPKHTILVSTVIDIINNNKLDNLNASFIDKPFNWPAIKKNCGNVTVFHGDNDSYVPLTQAETISEKLDTSLHIIKDGGHINTESGYTEFPEILEYLNG